MKTSSLSAFGKKLTAFSFAFDYVAWRAGEQSGLKATANMSATAYTFAIGGPVGFTLGAAYMVIDKTVGFDYYMDAQTKFINQERTMRLPTKPY